MSTFALMRVLTDRHGPAVVDGAEELVQRSSRAGPTARVQTEACGVHLPRRAGRGEHSEPQLQARYAAGGVAVLGELPVA